jgi:hypothetical protein
MKRKDLIATVEKKLDEIGFSKGAWLWQPRSSQLVLIIGNTLKTVSLKTSMTKTALIFELGRLAGLAEAAGIIPSQKPNGYRAALNGAGASFGAAAGFAGMPA